MFHDSRFLSFSSYAFLAIKCRLRRESEKKKIQCKMHAYFLPVFELVFFSRVFGDTNDHFIVSLSEPASIVYIHTNTQNNGYPSIQLFELVMWYSKDKRNAWAKNLNEEKFDEKQNTSSMCMKKEWEKTSRNRKDKKIIFVTKSSHRMAVYTFINTYTHIYKQTHAHTIDPQVKLIFFATH